MLSQMPRTCSNDKIYKNGLRTLLENNLEIIHLTPCLKILREMGAKWLGKIEVLQDRSTAVWTVSCS